MNKQSYDYVTPLDIASFLGIDKTTIQFLYKDIKALDNIPREEFKKKRITVPCELSRKILEKYGFVFPKKVVSFQIVKGGVGKTSLSFSLSIRASSYGAKVLAIDLDQQANLTRSFNVDSRNKKITLDLIRNRTTIDEIIVPITDFLHLIPSNLNNSILDLELHNLKAEISNCLVDKIKPVKDKYDLIIIDCPPSINLINTAATCFSDTVIIPVNSDPYSIDGMIMTISEIQRIKEIYNKDFDYRIIWNKIDLRERLSLDHLLFISEHKDYIKKFFKTCIGVDSSIKNSVFCNKSIFDISKKNKNSACEDIDYFTKELLAAPSVRETNGSINN